MKEVQNELFSRERFEGVKSVRKVAGEAATEGFET